LLCDGFAYLEKRLKLATSVLQASTDRRAVGDLLRILHELEHSIRFVAVTTTGQDAFVVFRVENRRSRAGVRRPGTHIPAHCWTALTFTSRDLLQRAEGAKLFRKCCTITPEGEKLLENAVTQSGTNDRRLGRDAGYTGETRE
jgi:hypothetical protein